MKIWLNLIAQKILKRVLELGYGPNAIVQRVSGSSWTAVIVVGKRTRQQLIGCLEPSHAMLQLISTYSHSLECRSINTIRVHSGFVYHSILEKFHHYQNIKMVFGYDEKPRISPTQFPNKTATSVSQKLCYVTLLEKWCNFINDYQTNFIRYFLPERHIFDRTNK